MTDIKHKSNQSPKFKMFIGGLKSSTTAKELLKYFKVIYPGILRVEVPLKFPNTAKQRNKGFAIAHTRDLECYEQIIERQSLVYQGRKLAAREFLKGTSLKASQAKKIEKRVFLTNMVADLSTPELKAKLEEDFGKVEDLFKLKHPFTGKEKDCGYCFFSKKSSALNAIQRKFIQVRGFKIDLNIFEKREDEEEGEASPKKSTDEEECRKESADLPNPANNHAIRPTHSSYHDISRMSMIRKLNSQTVQKQVEIFNLKRRTLEGSNLAIFRRRVNKLYHRHFLR